MANRFAIADADFSLTSTWSSTAGGVGGSSVPTTGDSAMANNHTVQITGNVTCTDLRNDTQGSATAGGGFQCATNGLTVTANLVAGGVATPCLIFSLASTNSIAIVGNVTGGSISGAAGIKLTGTGIVNITGNVLGGTAVSARGVELAALGTVNVTGNVTGGSAGIGLGSSTTTGGNVTVTGNVTASTSAIGVSGSNAGNPFATCTITGTVTADAVAAVAFVQTLQITGTVQAGAAAPLSTITVVVRVTGPLKTNATGVSPLGGVGSAPVLWVTPTTPSYMEVRTATSLALRALYTADSVGGNPAVTDVRNGTVYGPAGGTITGTAYIPGASSVAAGVNVDATVGTAVITVAALMAAALPSAPTANTLGEALFIADNLVGRINTAAGGAASSITFDAGASSTDGRYVGYRVFLYGGTGGGIRGVGQERSITAYNGTTKVATVAQPWGTNPDNTTTFMLYVEPWANVGSWNGTPVTTPNTAGTPVVDATRWAGGTIPAPNVTGVPLIDLKYTLGTISPATAGSVRADAVTGLTAADVGAIKTKTDFLPSATAGAAGGVFIAGTNAATSITTGLTAHIIGTVDTVTTLTNLPAITSNWLTAAGIAANALNGKGDWMATYTQPTGFLAATFPGTVASPTNITAGTMTTVTNLTNAPSAGDFTAAMKTSLNAATPAVTVSDKTGFSLTAAYDAAKTAAQAGDAMALTSGERTSTATAVWASASRSLTTFGTLVADTATAVWTAISRTITGTVTLDATQGSYAPAKAGDAMTLTGAYDAAKTAASQSSVNAIPTTPLLAADYTAPDNATIANNNAGILAIFNNIGTPADTVSADIAAISTATTAIGIRTAVGLSNPDLDQQLAAKPSLVDILRTAMTEGYAMAGSAPTLEQFLFMIEAQLRSRVLTGTAPAVLTSHKLDGVTDAMTFSVDDTTSPSVQERVS